MLHGHHTLASRYTFGIDGQRSLFKSCYSEYGRHAFVTGRATSGPNVFYDCEGRYNYEDMGPKRASPPASNPADGCEALPNETLPI